MIIWLKKEEELHQEFAQFGRAKMYASFFPAPLSPIDGGKCGNSLMHSERLPTRTEGEL
jgi:hypothetical protein